MRHPRHLRAHLDGAGGAEFSGRQSRVHLSSQSEHLRERRRGVEVVGQRIIEGMPTSRHLIEQGFVAGENAGAGSPAELPRRGPQAR